MPESDFEIYGIFWLGILNCVIGLIVVVKKPTWGEPDFERRLRQVFGIEQRRTLSVIVGGGFVFFGCLFIIVWTLCEFWTPVR